MSFQTSGRPVVPGSSERIWEDGFSFLYSATSYKLTNTFRHPFKGGASRAKEEDIE